MCPLCIYITKTKIKTASSIHEFYIIDIDMLEFVKIDLFFEIIDNFCPFQNP